MRRWVFQKLCVILFSTSTETVLMHLAATALMLNAISLKIQIVTENPNIYFFYFENVSEFAFFFNFTSFQNWKCWPSTIMPKASSLKISAQNHPNKIPFLCACQQWIQNGYAIIKYNIYFFLVKMAQIHFPDADRPPQTAFNQEQSALPQPHIASSYVK